MTAFAWEWLAFALRALHVVAAIFWIGAALAFLRLNLTLKATQRDIWRSGDDAYFHIARQTSAPPQRPQIGWFRWEAYVTWLSGLALLAAVYFVDADFYLIDPSIMALTRWQAIGATLAGIFVVQIAYELICKAPLPEAARRALVFATIALAAFVFAHVFAARGAMLILGASLGTIMTANVAHVLAPNQRRMWKALQAGSAPKETRLAASRQRALDNNYLALPTVFLMLSSHSPLAYAEHANWIIALLLVVAGAAIRHFYIARHRGAGDLWWTWALAAAACAGVLALSLWAGTPGPH
ncbi:MAG: urate hydroxylase PuuD [Hyphomicrobiales bacterium]|nr:urate hydroxylase PuuD [Hyphomicrobiales bacterium]